MSSVEDFLSGSFVYLSAAVVAVPLAKRAGLGSVLGYLIAGAIIGPYCLELVGEEGESVLHFAEFGVVLMLFLVGLELRPRRLWQMRGPILGLGGLQLLVTGAALAGVALALGSELRGAVGIGLILALSSTAMVIQSLEEKGLLQQDAGQNAFSVLLFQDIAVIPLFAILPLLGTPPEIGAAAGHGAPWIDTLPPWARPLVFLGAVAGVVVTGRTLLRPAFRAIARTGLREMFTAASLMLVIGTTLLMTLVGLSPALGTFLAGVVLADNEYRHQLESDIEPVKGLLLGIFFIAVGASIDFALIRDHLGVVLLWVAALFVVKALVCYGLGRAFRMHADQRLIFAVALAQGGEFAFVLFSFAVHNQVVTAATAGILVASVALSMAATPLAMLANERFLLPRLGTRRSTQETEESDHPTVDEQHAAILVGFGRFGNVVGRLLRANGIEATILERDSDRVEMLRHLGIRAHYGDGTRIDLLRAAGAESAQLLIIAIEEQDQVIDLVRCARSHFPHLQILARGVGRLEAREIYAAGADRVFRELFDSALECGIEALHRMGRRAFQVRRAARIFRRHDEAMLEEFPSTGRHRMPYLSQARRRIETLETILRAENDERRVPPDHGWDAESRG